MDFEIRELLKSPVGSFRPSTWLQVERCLQYLRERENIYLSFQLLDRVVQEPDAKVRVRSDMMYQLVEDWLAIFIRQQQKYQRTPSKHKREKLKKMLLKRQEQVSPGDQQPTLSPLAVWKKIESYQRRSIPLESPVYQKIIEGTSYVRSRKPNHPSGPILAETILECMMTQSERKNPLLRPSVSAFREVLASWEQAAYYCPEVAANEAPQHAMRILDKLRTLYDSGWGDDFLPDKMCFYKVMNIYAQIGDGDQVEALLEDLYNLYLDHGENLYDLRPTIPFFSLVLYAWSRSNIPGAAERAEAILERMLEIEANQEIRDFKVGANCFNISIVCWNKQRTSESVNRVQNLFDRMVTLSLEDKDKRPTGGSYSALISTWSRRDPFKVESVYRMWLEKHEQGETDMRRDSDLLESLVSSWYHSNEPAKANHCDDLIQEAIRSNIPDFQPTTAIFNMAVAAWCSTKTVDGLQRAEELLLQMELCDTKSSPDVMTYMSIIQGWVNIGRVERAEELLTDCFLQIEGHNGWDETVDPFEESEERGNDSRQAGPFRNRRERRRKLTKTQVLNCVLKGWISKASIVPEAASRAEDLLLSTHAFDVKPNAATFQHVLDAWRKNAMHFKGDHMGAPKVDDVVAMLDRAPKRLGGDESLYLKLRQNWRLLAIR